MMADLEVLTEVLPCGIDPLGVFILQKDGESQDLDKEYARSLVEQLPEAFLEVTDPLILHRSPKGVLTVFRAADGELKEVQYESISGDEMDSLVQIVRVKGKLSLVSLQTEQDLQVALRHWMEKVSCPYGAFKMERSDLLFLHVWESKRKSARAGWAEESVQQEDVEQAFVANLPEDAEIVSDLWRSIKEEEEEDDGFGSLEQKKKKKTIDEGEVLNFRLKMKMSGEAFSSKTLNCAPVLYYEKSKKCANCDFDSFPCLENEKNVRVPITVDSLGVTRKTTKIPDLMEVLKGCVQRQIHETGER